MKNSVFPNNFLWGAATSAYQIEGGASLDNKTDSIWDVFCRKKGAIANEETGDIAIDHYHLWEQDLKIAKDLNLKAYRFSISWPRIFPERKKQNMKGIEFYEKIIDTLIQYKIEPIITLFHWDLPKYLQDLGGWANRDVVEDFVEYATYVFDKYKGKVKYWITHNEPWVVANLGYAYGVHAPGIISPELVPKVNHHLLLSHGLAVQSMRSMQPSQVETKIGIGLNLAAIFPANSQLEKDRTAANKFKLEMYDQYLQPLFKGKYPPNLDNKDFIRAGDIEDIKTPVDFLGVNYYTKHNIQSDSNSYSGYKVVEPSPNSFSSMWDFYPEGIFEVINEIHSEYTIKEILITENGTACNHKTSANEEVNDNQRIKYIEEHLKQVARLICEGVPISGYFYWSLFDNFEWAFGYDKRFGLVSVDYLTQKRTIKKSGEWLAQFIESKRRKINSVT